MAKYRIVKCTYPNKTVKFKIQVKRIFWWDKNNGEYTIYFSCLKDAEDAISELQRGYQEEVIR